MHDIQKQTVEEYIYKRKGIKVTINLRNPNDVYMMLYAYDIAVAWLNENK